MWIKNKRGLLLNTDYFMDIDVVLVEKEDETIWEVQATQGGVNNVRATALYWGALAECSQYVKGLEELLDARHIPVVELKSPEDLSETLGKLL